MANFQNSLAEVKAVAAELPAPVAAAMDDRALKTKATSLELSRRSGLSIDFVEQNYEAVAQSLGYAGDPSADFSSGVDNSERVRKASEASLEMADAGVLKTGRNVGQSFVAAIPQTLGRGMQGVAAINNALANRITSAIEKVTPPSVGEFLRAPIVPAAIDPERSFREVGSMMERGGLAIDVPEGERGLATDIAGGVGQIVAQAVATLLNPAAGISVMAGEGADLQRRRAQEQGMEGTLEGDVSILGGAVVTGTLEKFQMGKLLDKAPYLNDLLKFIPDRIKSKWLGQTVDVTSAGLGEAIQETVEGVFQDAITEATTNPDQEYFQEWERQAIAAGGAASIFRALVNTVMWGRGRMSVAQHEKTPAGEFLSEDGYSPESFNALSKAMSEQEFTAAFESDTLKDLARAAYNGSEGAQDALRTFSESIKIMEGVRRERAAEARRAEDESMVPDFEMTRDEVEAFREYERVDPTETMSEQELAEFEAERDALTPEQEALMAQEFVSELDPEVEMTEDERVALTEIQKLDPALFEDAEYLDTTEQLTPEQESRLEAEFRTQAEQEALVDTVDFDRELLKVVKEKGGLLATDPALQGEIDRVAENLKETKAMPGLIRKDAMRLDDLRRSLAEDGFEFETISEMVEAISESAGGIEFFPMQGGAIFNRPREAKAKRQKLSRAERIKVEKAKVRETYQKRLDDFKESKRKQIARERIRGDEKAFAAKVSFAKKIQKKIEQNDRLSAKFDAFKEKARQQRVGDRRRSESQKADIRIAAAKRLQKEMDKRVAAVRKAFRERQDITESIKALETMVKALPLKVRGKFTGFGSLASLKTLEAQQRKLDESIQRIDAIFDDYVRRELRTTLGKRLRRLKVTDGADAKRIDVRVTPEIREAVNLALSQANKPQEQALADAEGFRMESGEFKDEQALIDYYVATTFAGVLHPDAKADDIAAALSALDFMVDTGRTRAAEIREKRKAEMDDIRDGLLNAFVKSGKRAMTPNEFALRENRIGRIGKAMDNIAAFSVHGMGALEILLDNMSYDPGRFKGAVTDTVVYPTMQATLDERDIRTEYEKMYVDGLSDAMGIHKNTRNSEVKAILDRLKNWSVVQEDTGIVYKSGGRDPEVQPMSVKIAISLVMAWDDKRLATTFEKMGVTQETIDAARKFVGDEALKAIPTIRKIYRSIGHRIVDTTEEVEGYRPRFSDYYSPIHRFDYNFEKEAMELVGDDYARSYAKNSSLKMRTESTSELVFKEFDADLSRHIKQMSHYLAFAKQAKVLNNVLLSPQVRAAMFQSSGSHAVVSMVERQVKDILQTTKNIDFMERWAGKMLGNLAVSKLFFNPPSAFKQFGSAIAGAAFIPSSSFAKETAKMWSSPKNLITALNTIRNTRYANDRWTRGHERDVAYVVDKLSEGIIHVNGWADKGMILTRLADMGGVLMAGYPVYRYHYEQNRSKGHVEATQIAEKEFALAADRVQQSALPMSLSHYQRLSNFLKVLTLYMTSPIQYQRTLNNAFIAWKRGRIDGKDLLKSFAIFHVLLPQVFTAMGSAFMLLWEDDEDKLKRLRDSQLRALLLGNLNAIPLAGDVLGAVSAGLVEMITGEDAPNYEFNPDNQLFKELETVSRGIGDLSDAEDAGEAAIASEKILEGVLSITTRTGYSSIKRQVVAMFEGLTDEDEENPILRTLGFTEHALAQDSKSSSSTSSRSARPSRESAPSRSRTIRND